MPALAFTTWAIPPSASVLSLAGQASLRTHQLGSRSHFKVRAANVHGI